MIKLINKFFTSTLISLFITSMMTLLWFAVYSFASQAFQDFFGVAPKPFNLLVAFIVFAIITAIMFYVMLLEEKENV